MAYSDLGDSEHDDDSNVAVNSSHVPFSLEDDRKEVFFIALGIIRLNLAIFGILANIISALVLTNRKLWSPTSMLLLSLVVYDAVYLLLVIPLSASGVYVNFHASRDTMMVMWTITRVTYPLRYMAQMGSTYTTVTITIERCLIILLPLRAKSMWTRGVTRRAISGVLIFSVLFNVPRCFDHILSPGAGALSSSFKSNSSVPAGVENVHVPSVNVKLSSTKFKSPLGADNINYDPKKCFSIENRTVATGHVRDSNCQSLDYQNAALSLINGDDEEGARDSLPVVGSLLDDDTNKWETTERGKIQRSNDSTRSESGIYFLYHEVYISYLTTFFLYLIPYTLIILFNARLLIALRRRREETRRVSVRQEHRIRSLPGPAPTDREDDLTYIVLGITFCFFVCCILPTVYMISALANRFSDNTTSILMTAGETTLVINASTDFLFYCLLGRKFRRVFMKLFCPKRYLQQTRAIRLTSTVSYSSV